MAEENRLNILLAEDDIVTRNLVKLMVDKWGFALHTAGDGNTAWEMLKTNSSLKIAIIDWVMPGMDGIELCRKIRETISEHYVYIIMLTSNSTLDHLLTGLDAGADDFITKPFNEKELLARLNTARRLADIHNRLRERDRLAGALEMAGAVCHEMNQPLQAILGFSELLLMDFDPESENYMYILQIKDNSKRLGELTKKIMGLSHYKSRKYVGSDTKIIDIKNHGNEVK